eukprot:TRINITY_DN1240_c0_g1_i2.p2 TRINITY_DN1240_c0_g1~~TRINITY_DN1240_c0_g1_i2.p2  ORF type:complete len:159 (-),score=0.08 TRINITY_DN1240_c0_g1_i2:24-500(-)
MLIPTADRLLILRALFAEGVMAAKKDFNQPKHNLLDTKNLYVINLMKSLVSRGYVKVQFSWQWYYWFLNDEGIEWLRAYLHLPEDEMPNSLKKGAASRPGDRGDRGDRRDDRGDRGRGRSGPGGRGRGGFDRRDKKFGDAPAASAIGFQGGRGRDFNK